MVAAIVVMPTRSTMLMVLFPTMSLLRYICLLTLIASAAATTQQVSKSNTLPPSVSTNNSSDPCDFADRNSLLARIESEWQSHNISLLVQTCPGVCLLIYGSGNPDISGIGVILRLCQELNLKAENNKGHDILLTSSHLNYLVWTFIDKRYGNFREQKWQIIGTILNNLRSCI